MEHERSKYYFVTDSPKGFAVWAAGSPDEHGATVAPNSGHVKRYAAGQARAEARVVQLVTMSLGTRAGED